MSFSEKNPKIYLYSIPGSMIFIVYNPILFDACVNLLVVRVILIKNVLCYVVVRSLSTRQFINFLLDLWAVLLEIFISFNINKLMQH